MITQLGILQAIGDMARAGSQGDLARKRKADAELATLAGKAMKRQKNTA
jgi:hypothetical protein